MKRFLYFTLILALFISCRTAGEPSGSSVWMVSKDGNTLYLGGSIHILREDDFPLPKEFDLALSESEVLVLEADVEQMEDDEVVRYVMSQMFLSDNQTLATLLDPDVYTMLSDSLNEYGLPIESISGFKPSMVMTMLTMIQFQEYGFTQEGIDFYYLQKALDENKQIQFLESVESQIDMLVSMGEGYENDFVLYSLQDLENTGTFLTTILNDWRTGESESTEMSLISMKEEWPQTYKSMITDRHDAWMPQIEEFLDSGSTYFVIAGLLHMHGPDGLLKQLEDKGCTIEQLK